MDYGNIYENAHLSSAALLSISAVDAVLVTSLMPVFSIFIERIFGTRFRTYLLPLCGFLASLTAFCAVLSARGSLGAFSLTIGHFEIVAAIIFFTLHLSLYSRMTKEPSPVNPLMVQFTLAALLLLPADLGGYQAFSSFTTTNWIQFTVYAVVCNLLPFVLVHYALKLTSPLAVASASIASPLFGIVFARIISGTEIVPSFIAFTVCSLVLTWTTIRINMKEKSSEV